MIIGIDIDGVLNDLHYFNKNYGSLFCSQQNWPILCNEKAYKVREMFNWSKEQEREFYRNYYSLFINSSKFIRPYAQEALHILHKKHQIIIITSRLEKDVPEDEEKSIGEITQSWLDANNLEYDEFICDSSDKLCSLKQKGIQLMIEDNPHFFIDTPLSIPLICFDAEYNQNIQGTNIYRIFNWYQIKNLIETIESTTE